MSFFLTVPNAAHLAFIETFPNVPGRWWGNSALQFEATRIAQHIAQLREWAQGQAHKFSASNEKNQAVGPQSFGDSLAVYEVIRRYVDEELSDVIKRYPELESAGQLLEYHFLCVRHCYPLFLGKMAYPPSRRCLEELDRAESLAILEDYLEQKFDSSWWYPLKNRPDLLSLLLESASLKKIMVDCIHSGVQAKIFLNCPVLIFCLSLSGILREQKNLNEKLRRNELGEAEVLVDGAWWPWDKITDPAIVDAYHRRLDATAGLQRPCKMVRKGLAFDPEAVGVPSNFQGLRVEVVKEMRDFVLHQVNLLSKMHLNWAAGRTCEEDLEKRQGAFRDTLHIYQTVLFQYRDKEFLGKFVVRLERHLMAWIRLGERDLKFLGDVIKEVQLFDLPKDHLLKRLQEQLKELGVSWHWLSDDIFRELQASPQFLQAVTSSVHQQEQLACFLRAHLPLQIFMDCPVLLDFIFANGDPDSGLTGHFIYFMQKIRIKEGEPQLLFLGEEYPWYQILDPQGQVGGYSNSTFLNSNLTFKEPWAWSQRGIAEFDLVNWDVKAWESGRIFGDLPEKHPPPALEVVVMRNRVITDVSGIHVFVRLRGAEYNPFQPGAVPKQLVEYAPGFNPQDNLGANQACKEVVSRLEQPDHCNFVNKDGKMHVYPFLLNQRGYERAIQVMALVKLMVDAGDLEYCFFNGNCVFFATLMLQEAGVKLGNFGMEVSEVIIPKFSKAANAVARYTPRPVNILGEGIGAFFRQIIFVPLLMLAGRKFQAWSGQVYHPAVLGDVCLSLGAAWEPPPLRMEDFVKIGLDGQEEDVDPLKVEEGRLEDVEEFQKMGGQRVVIAPNPNKPGKYRFELQDPSEPLPDLPLYVASMAKLLGWPVSQQDLS